MEIIQLAGTATAKKAQHAKQYLIPRQVKENGLTEDQLVITDNAVTF